MNTETLTKRILINKDSSKGQIRVALIDNQNLYDLEIEYAEKEQKVDSICNGEVISIEPSLEAAFIKYGAARNGFLPRKEIAPEYYPEGVKDSRSVSIKDLLFEGQKLLVQITKEERGNKGAALTTYISLAGCYLVLMPNNPKAGGISRRIEGGERDELKNILNGLNIPEGMGVIVRTAGMGKSLEELQWDLDVLLTLWEAIKTASQSHGAPFLIHQESDIATRAVRDYLRPDVAELLVDDEETYKNIRHYVERVRPAFADRVKLYKESANLFSHFNIEKQIESAFQRKVRLPSGGEIVIDRSEALTAIDVNSAQSTKGSHIEDTALHTNLESAKEIATQLRIRDLGGLFVIDFIDMDIEANNHKVEECLKEALKNDRARIQVGKLSRFGLLEMSRQRLRPALNEAFQVVCPRCHGQGSIRNIKSQAIALLRLMEEKALKDKPKQIRIQAPVDVATYLLNEQRTTVNSLELKYSTNILIIPNPHIETPEYDIKSVGTTGDSDHSSKMSSYELVSVPQTSYEPEKIKEHVAPKQEALVKDVLPAKQAPKTTRQSNKPGLLKRVLSRLFKKKSTQQNKSTQQHSRKPYPQNRNSRQRSSRTQTQRSGGYNRTRRGYRDYSASSPTTTKDSKSKPDSSSRGHNRQDQKRPTSSSKQGSASSYQPRKQQPPKPKAQNLPIVEEAKSIQTVPTQQKTLPKVVEPKFKSTPVPADLMQVETSHAQPTKSAEVTKPKAPETTRKMVDVKNEPKKKPEAPEELVMIETKTEE